MNNKININKNSKIYILTPAFYKTGGTELLHQLYYKMSQKYKNVFIVYYNRKDITENCTHKEFKMYNVKECLLNQIEYNEKNLIIIPEIYLSELNKFKNKNIKKAIWWLSVDNATKFFGFFGILFYYKTKGLLRLFNAIRKNKISLRCNLLKEMDYNFCQSYYAIDFLKRQGIEKNVYYLSDYINKTYFEKEFSFQAKENIVLYNPKKGINFTKKIMKKTNFRWIPIEKMTTIQVRDLLLKSKVYIDFGNHPGKDRFPREAAISGCCVITGKRGAAKFYKDIPIKDEFKFDDKENSIGRIVKKIESCLLNYDEEIVKFDEYRKFIQNEEKNFEKDINEIFIKEDL